MSLRARIASTAAGAVAVAVLLVAVGVYAATRRQLERELDRDLLQTATTLAQLAPDDLAGQLAAVGATGPETGPEPRRPRLRRDPGPRGRFGDDDRVERLLGPLGGGTVQVVGDDGEVLASGGAELGVPATVTRFAVGPDRSVGSPLVYDATIGTGRAVRVAAAPLVGGGAVQVAAAVDADEPALAALRRQLLVAGVLGAGLAALLGLLVADRAVRPVRALTVAAEDVRRTGDLTTRIDVGGGDELARLASSFNGMLAALGVARAAQQQLVADASHELRTPITSLRTNLEVLQLGGDRLTRQEHGALLGDVTGQLEELGRLVDGLVELARGDRPAQAPTPVVLGQLVEDVAERARVFAGDVPLTVRSDDTIVVAERDRLERAVANLLDNARKHGGGAPVEVEVEGGVVTVRDHGPGIPADDLGRVFERFYRAPDARGRPGSGLGLSIVAQVADSHGGRVDAANHPDGGAVVTLALPVAG